MEHKLAAIVANTTRRLNEHQKKKKQAFSRGSTYKYAKESCWYKLHQLIYVFTCKLANSLAR